MYGNDSYFRKTHQCTNTIVYKNKIFQGSQTIPIREPVIYTYIDYHPDTTYSSTEIHCNRY